jgi:hypothetical protein
MGRVNIHCETNQGYSAGTRIEAQFHGTFIMANTKTHTMFLCQEAYKKFIVLCLHNNALSAVLDAYEDDIIAIKTAG